jgi:N-acetylmuramoyl-L-alanine amidase
MKKTVAKIMILLTLLMSVSPMALAANLGDRTLMLGSTGDDVAQLQQRLNNLGFLCGNVDGDFGPLTQDAVIRFQKVKGFVPDGIVGPATLAAMSVQSTSRGSVGRFSQRDIDILARLVYAEARGESYIGQVAVAATVLNRLEDPNYPNSIPEIVYQIVDGYYQYSPVLDGQINMTPDETARRAALDAISGHDPTGGATTFFNPSKTSDQWVRSRPYSTTIGNHVFAK